VLFYHVGITAADAYLTRRAAHRPQHLERIAGLRAQGLVIGGGPAPDGKSADLFYRVPDPDVLTRLVEDDPYWKGGVWTAYAPEAFSQFLEPWRLPDLSTDGSRLTMLVEGETPDVEMATFALIEERGAGRVAFGGFFPDGRTLVLVNAADPGAAVSRLADTGFWAPGTLRARPFLHVL
jgi:uncharacterized protein YciI